MSAMSYRLVSCQECKRLTDIEDAHFIDDLETNDEWYVCDRCFNSAKIVPGDPFKDAKVVITDGD